MRKRLTLFIAAMIFATVSILAQSDEHKQILVFRKSGVTNIFYADKIARIELTKFDTDSVEHDEIVSQAFVRSDGSAVIVPIADISSVEFGSRNSIKAKESVRRLTDEEADAIEEFDETKLKYKAGTSASLVVKAGEKVYYDKITDVLPYGLCAQVKSVGTENGVTVASIEYLAPQDLFDEYFLSGDEAMPMSRALEEDDFEKKPFEFELPEINNGGIRASGHVKLIAGGKAEDVVFDPCRHYYHAKITAYISPELKFAFESPNSAERNFVSNPMPGHIKIPTAWGALSFDVDLGGFIDFKVEAGVDYEYKTEYKAVFEWERKDGVNTFTKPVFTQNPLGDMEQKIQCYLKGELFLGALADLSIGMLWERFGAGAQLKFGPLLEADFSLGVLNQLSETYSQELFGKAALTLSAKLGMETYAYRRDHWLLGQKERTKLPIEFEIPYEIGKLNLFPEFHTRSTVNRERKPLVKKPDRAKAIDVATYTEKPVETEIEVGFELADPQTDETVAQIWDEEKKDIIQPKSEEAQSFDTEFALRDELKDIDPEKVVVRPVFKYRDKIVKAAPATPLSGMFLSPVIYHGNRNAKYIVSGPSVVNQSEIDETTYHQGNILPVVEKNNKYGKRTANTVEFIEIDIPGSTGIPRSSLIGTWTGSVADENVSLTFTDDSTGSYSGEPFTYRVNSPLKGGISIKMENGSTITFLVLNLDSSTMTIAPQASKKQYTLTRQ